VIGRPGNRGARMTAVESALFDSGRPVLMAPPTPPATLGETVLIHWNASTETARNMLFAMPVLRKAKRVSLIAVEGAMVPGPSIKDAVGYLEANGIAATDKTVTGRGNRPGEVILAEAAAVGADLLIKGLETGIVEGDGKFFKQKRTEVRPGPYKSWKGRFYSVAMSSDSVPVVARLGAKMMSFAQKPWEQMTGHFNAYRQQFQQIHNRAAPAPVCVDFLCCNESAEQAEALAREHMSNYYLTVMEHYDMAGDHFKKMKGYGDYATNAALLKDIGLQDAANGFTDINTWGTPQQILEKLEQRRRVLGPFDLTVQVSYGGMTLENAEKSIRLFAKEVLPEFQSWKEDAGTAAKAANA
jgi:alkanesulfonate monooxygenase SsuD/methylene tetrahydromethanopterin reductase-like flavin-dependent oxidoreductase (luciferase family)